MWLVGKQEQTPPTPPAMEREDGASPPRKTMTLTAKAEMLRTHFSMAAEAPLKEIVAAAIAELGLGAQVQGLNLMQKADACLAALGKRDQVAPEPAELSEVLPEVVPMEKPVDESILAMEARAREAEQRAQRAEAELRVREAEMRAQAAEQALAQQSRMAQQQSRMVALEKALRDAMPGWHADMWPADMWYADMWSVRNTAPLKTAIAQAEAAAPPEGSTLLAALLAAKEALRSLEEDQARKDAEERARREAADNARREAEARESRARQTAQARAEFPHLVNQIKEASKALKLLAVFSLFSLCLGFFSLSIPNFRAAGVIEGCCSHSMGLAEARSCREACGSALIVNGVGMVGLIIGVCAPARKSAFPAPDPDMIRLKPYLAS